MICPTCNLDKPDTDFYLDQRDFKGWCRKCTSEEYQFLLKEFEEKTKDWTKEQWIEHFNK